MKYKLLITLFTVGLLSLPTLADGNVIHSWETEQGNCGHKACKGETEVVPDTPVTPSIPSIPSSNLFPAQYNHQPIYDGINNNYNAINQLHNQVSTNTQNINSLQQGLNNTNERIDNMGKQLKTGLATVTALTSLHPNPRATGRTEIAVGTGFYRDRVAGAVGLFHHFNDNVMLSGGVSYGGNTEWAGNVGLTYSFGRRKK